MSGDDAVDGEPARPLLRVVRGQPTPAEVAALMAVLSLRTAGGAAEEPSPAPSTWGRPRMRAALSPGAGAWRASALPQ